MAQYFRLFIQQIIYPRSLKHNVKLLSKKGFSGIIHILSIPLHSYQNWVTL